VYETTTSAEAINITQLHYLMSFTPQAVSAVQIFVLGNQSNQTYIGSQGQTFAFSLPQNAQNVMFEGDEAGTRFVETAGGYADTAPITPGKEGLSIVATYEVPYEDILTIQVPIPDDVASANVLVQDQGAQLNSDQLQFVEKRQFQDDSFSIFSAANLKKGQELTLNLSGLDNLTFTGAAAAPGAIAPTRGFDQNLLRWIIVGLGGAVIVFVAVGYPYLRPQFRSQADNYAEDPGLRRQKLLLLLARLDEAFAGGELDKRLYHRARAKYKAELMQLMEE
jgi:hypothetical protein